MAEKATPIFRGVIEGLSPADITAIAEALAESWGYSPNAYRIAAPTLHPIAGPLRREGVTGPFRARVEIFPATPTDTLGMLMISRSPDRSNPRPLLGETWKPGEKVYVFLDAPMATLVRFSLDGVDFTAEASPPWDFAGGSATAANPFTVTNAGTHTITAAATIAGQILTFGATFTVKP